MPFQPKIGTFEDVLKAALEKEAIVPEEFYDLPEEFRYFAFTVSGIERQSQIKLILDLLKDVVENRGTFNDFKTELKKNREVYESIAESRHALVHRNFTRTNFSRGRYDAAIRNKNRRPYARFVALPDARPSHLARHGIIVKVGSSYYEQNQTPLFHNCRCRWVTMTLKQAMSFGGPTSKADLDIIEKIGVMIAGVDGLVKTENDDVFSHNWKDLDLELSKRASFMPNKIKQAALAYQKRRKDDVETFINKKRKKFDMIVTDQKNT